MNMVEFKLLVNRAAGWLLCTESKCRFWLMLFRNSWLLSRENWVRDTDRFLPLIFGSKTETVVRLLTSSYGSRSSSCLSFLS